MSQDAFEIRIEQIKAQLFTHEISTRVNLKERNSNID